MTLSLYLLRGFLWTVAAVFIVLASVVVLFSMVENLRRFGDTAASFGDILKITLLQVPEVLYQIFPLVLLLASLLSFLRLARSSELVVMRAAGLAALRLIAVPFLASLALGVLFVVAVNPFVAATMKQGQMQEGAFRSSRASSLSFSKEGLWLRQADETGQTVVQAARSDETGSTLSGVRMHRFDADGRLYSRVDAPVAHLTPGAWKLMQASIWELDETGRFTIIQSKKPFSLGTELTNQQIQDSFSPPEMIGFWNLGEFIRQVENSGFSGLRHRLYLQSELAKPALFAAMVLIGSAFALRPARFGQTGVMMLLAVMAGFFLYFLKDFAESMGAQGQIPIHLAVWAPPLAAILLAVGLLLHLEDG